MKIKVSEASGPVLDWMVAQANGVKVSKLGPGNKPGVWLVSGEGWYEKREPYKPSTDWSQGGPIIERERISIENSEKYGWVASKKGPCEIGPTALIAAMRCYVTAKLGEEVEVPNEVI